MSATRTTMIPPMITRCLYILRSPTNHENEDNIIVAKTYCRIIVLIVPDARSIDVSAVRSYRSTTIHCQSVKDIGFGMRRETHSVSSILDNFPLLPQIPQDIPTLGFRLKRNPCRICQSSTPVPQHLRPCSQPFPVTSFIIWVVRCGCSSHTLESICCGA